MEVFIDRRKEGTSNMDKRIVIFNNATGIVDVMCPLLVREGIQMLVAANLQQLELLLKKGNIHLIMIDVNLDACGMEKGIGLIAGLRKKTTIPIIVVSEEETETAKIMAFNAGADDYVTADCNPLELLARVNSQLRRYIQLVNLCTNLDSIYEVDGLEINDIHRTVSVEGKEVKLTPIEYKILRLLVQQRGKVLSINQIYEAIWQMRPIGADNTIAVHIRHIREKIESNPKNPRYLKVVWGTGYKVG